MRPASAVFSLFESALSRPWTCLLAALACVVAESWTVLDQAAQSVFFRGGGWLIGKAFHRAHEFTLYTAPKLAIGAVAAVAVVVIVLGFLPPKHLVKSRLAPYRERLILWRAPCLLLFLSICLVPLAVAAIKALTGVYSPVDLLPYGSRHAHIGVLDHLWTYGRPDTGRSFPAGHASGGFALVALYYLPLTPRNRTILAAAGFVLGWLMGLYQMARGEHFLTHTLTTMFLAFGIVGFLARFLRCRD
jgi:membrane-associated PAP2 superfamily phosphatase